MASSILVRDVLYRASSQLLDLSPQFTRWTERELVNWLNDAQRAIAKYLPSSCARVDAIRLKAGTKQSIELIAQGDVIPGDGSAATAVRGNMVQDVIRNLGVNGSTPGRVVRRVDRESLDQSDPNWHTATAKTPVSQWSFDPRTPRVFYVVPPVPATSSWWLEVSYLANPADIPNPGNEYGMDGASTTVISIDDKHVDDILNYMLARAHMKDAEFAGNAQAVATFTNLFVSSINAQAAALTGVNPNLEVLPLTPSIPAAAK